MAAAATPAAKTQSWRPLFWGLAAFLVCPFLPFFELIIPVQQTLVLLVPENTPELMEPARRACKPASRPSTCRASVLASARR